MNPENKPLIYLLNTNSNLETLLKDKNFNAHRYSMNGYRDYTPDYHKPLSVPYKHSIPENLHEAELVIIDTDLRNSFLTKGSNINVFYAKTPSVVNLFPLDMGVAISNIFSTRRNQCVIVFCDSYHNESYTIYNEVGKKTTISNDTYGFPNLQYLTQRSGSRIKPPLRPSQEAITKCLVKHLDGSHYNIVFEQIFSSDDVLLQNDAGNVVGFIRNHVNKTLIFLPAIEKKEELILDLFMNVMPSIEEFKQFFPYNDSFSWVSDFSYISIEEKNKVIEIQEEHDRHQQILLNLKEQFKHIHNKDENVKLRNLLKETDDELVFSVSWFFDYIGFQNIETPDDEVVDEGDVFEEDLRVITDEIAFLFEVKGIGGTSTDANCAQISKIVNRRRKADRTKLYHGVYIVNHQRYKAPKERERIPFNDRQIEDAEIANRGMTFTYELFHVYHMIEAGILTKEAVREAFKQEGLINFRESLCSLTFNHCYKKPVVYSLIMEQQGGIVMTRNDKIAIQDNEEHWHLLTIEGLQIDSVDYEEVSSGTIGIKVDRIVPGARDFYMIKVDQDKGLQDA